MNFVISLLNGSVEGGSATNIAARIIGVLAVIGAVSFLVAAIIDWYVQRQQIGS
ncbi:hypothetical protein [Sphingomonas sp.]|uniref:hypothetical protein n=1 Tax=Sphingomonas sp. TaxID=28214 RepID=UPI003BAA7AB4